MVSLEYVPPLSSRSDISEPLVILAVALGLAGVAILVLFAKGQI